MRHGQKVLESFNEISGDCPLTFPPNIVYFQSSSKHRKREIMSNVKVKGKRGRPTKAVAAAKLAAKIEAARETNETHDERVKRISQRFTVMYRMAQGSIAGTIRSLVVSGAPGVGKSHTISHLLDSAQDRNLIRYEEVKGGMVTGVNLYKLMYRMSKENDVILMDDSDSVWDDESTLNLLKAGLDSSDRRNISWLSESASLKAEDIPQRFEYRGSMIFITNKDLQTIVDLNASKMAPHFAAIMSRSIYLDLKLHTTQDLVAWIKHMVSKNHILVQRGLSHNEEKVALEWFEKNYSNLRELSIRTMLKVADFMKTDASDWEMFAAVTLLR